MIGILAGGFAIPAARYASRAGPLAVAGRDEDAITLAVEAGEAALGDARRAEVEALLLGTCSSPLAEGSSATLVARMLDLPRTAAAYDVGGGLGAGTGALGLALELVSGGRIRKALVVAAETRVPEGDVLDPATGDGAAAFLVGEGEAVATLVARATATGPGRGAFRLAGEDRFRQGTGADLLANGFGVSVAAGLKTLFSRHGLGVRDFARVLIDSPDGFSHLGVAEQFDLAEPGKLFRNVGLDVGHTGAAHALLLLGAALEEARPGERLLLAGWGDGADVLAFEAQRGIERFRSGRPFSRGRERKFAIDEGEARRRRESRSPPARTGPAGVGADLADRFAPFRGVTCGTCGGVYSVPIRVCPSCHRRDGFSEIALGRRGIVYTGTVDRSGGGAEGFVVVNLLGGGRVLLSVTEAGLGVMDVGGEVEIVLRRLYDTATGPVWFYKARPVGGGS